MFVRTGWRTCRLQQRRFFQQQEQEFGTAGQQVVVGLCSEAMAAGIGNASGCRTPPAIHWSPSWATRSTFGMAPATPTTPATSEAARSAGASGVIMEESQVTGVPGSAVSPSVGGFVEYTHMRPCRWPFGGSARVPCCRTGGINQLAALRSPFESRGEGCKRTGRGAFIPGDCTDVFHLPPGT